MTDDIHVDPTALESMASAMRKLGSDNSQAEQHVAEYIPAAGEAGGEILHLVTDMLAQLEADLSLNYAALTRVSHESATALEASAESYRAQDTANAAALEEADENGTR